MKSMILGMLAETSIHPGAGRNQGFVDLPVAREGATDYPVIVGSSLKGALREHARQLDTFVDAGELERKKLDQLFGEQEHAGQLLVSDARLLLLPIRSLNSQYKWIICPHIIERMARDFRRLNQPAASLSESALRALNHTEYSALGQSPGDILFLEERQFSLSAPVDTSIIELIASLIPHPEVRARLERQLVVISDDDFTWFARYGLVVNARNVLEEDTKTSKNLWYEETLPPDSLFYALLSERRGEALKLAGELFQARPYLQVGGNATVGQGWFATQPIMPDSSNSSSQRGQR